jgi:hypothetical protein
VAPEWAEKVKELHGISFEIDRPRVALEDVAEEAKLSPSDIMLLADLLSYDESAPALRAVE